MAPSILQIALQVIVGLVILNVWLLRRGSSTPFRGGNARNMREEFEAYGLPCPVMWVVGTVKVALAFALLAAIWLPLLVRIAAYTEAHRPPVRLDDLNSKSGHSRPSTVAEAIASVVEHALLTVPCVAVFVPTRTGTTARMISRFKTSTWIVAVGHDPAVCKSLAFSYGVDPVLLAQDPDNWGEFVRQRLSEPQPPGTVAILVAGPSTRNPDANHRLEFLRVAARPATGK